MPAVKVAQPGTVRIDAIKVHTIVSSLTGIIPTTENDGAIAHNHGVQVMALVKGDLLDIAAIVIHDMKQKRRTVQFLVQAGILRLALIQQNRLGYALACG